jgi:hypothetical protein
LTCHRKRETFSTLCFMSLQICCRRLVYLIYIMFYVTAKLL